MIQKSYLTLKIESFSSDNADAVDQGRLEGDDAVDQGVVNENDHQLDNWMGNKVDKMDNNDQQRGR
jgi:hypothetical protein